MGMRRLPQNLVRTLKIIWSDLVTESINRKRKEICFREKKNFFESEKKKIICESEKKIKILD